MRTNNIFSIGNSGATAVEFALITPIMFMMFFGIIQVGIIYMNYVAVTDASRVGLRQFSISRGSATPYDSTISLINTAATSLTTANLTITLSVNGTTCTDNATCSSALVLGGSATVKIVYPCSLDIMGSNYVPDGCTLTGVSTGAVE